MTEKLDYKKAYPRFYAPGRKPERVLVPSMPFLMVDGRGAPDSPAYQAAVQTLYALTFTIKMSRLGGNAPAGYFDYVVPPLEGLWWFEGADIAASRREDWEWTALIRQPDFVTPAVFDWAVEECRRKKPEVDVSAAQFSVLEEGLCVQWMHIGPYADEPATIADLHRFMAEQGLADCTSRERRHHEIYLSDPRRTDPSRLRTILRLPVAE